MLNMMSEVSGELVRQRLLDDEHHHVEDVSGARGASQGCVMLNMMSKLYRELVHRKAAEEDPAARDGCEGGVRSLGRV